MPPLFSKKIAKVVIFFLFLSFAHVLYSQTGIEQATRETDRLGRKEIIEEKLKQPLKEKPTEEKPEEPLIRKEEEKFLIKKIDLVGCESFSPADFSPIVEKYKNREIGLTDLNALAKELERDYLRRGLIAAVFVPPQEIKDQTAVLRVVEARMGELEIQDHKYFRKERLNYYWHIPSGDILRYDNISRSVQLMNKNPDRQVKVVLRAGKKTGTTDIVLTPKTRLPIHVTGSFDNEGTASTGKGRIGYGLRHNNFLGIDDTLLAGYSFGNHFNGIYAYHSLPLTSGGLSLLYGYSSSESKPAKEYVSMGLKSEAKNANVSLHQDLYKKDVYLGEAFLGFDAKDKTVKLNTGTYNRDRLRIISLGANLVRQDFGSTTSFAPEVSQGIQYFGASDRQNPLASRGAKSTFTKVNLGLQHKRALPLNLQANLKFKGQISTTPLTPQEEFGLGGLDSVRGYPSSDYLADNAFQSNAELLIPSIFIPQNWRFPYAKESFRNQVTSLVFVDYGWGERRRALDTEKKDVNFLGIGAGLRINFFDQALLRLEWGFPMAGNRPVTEAGHSRFHFSVDFQEKLPEEIERIKKMVEEENIKQWAWQLVNEELARPESPLAKILHHYFYLGESYYRQGELEKSRERYEKVILLGRSLYMQAEEYVRSCLVREKELRERHALALANYQQGNPAKAKELWQKIIGEAKPGQLVLEF